MLERSESKNFDGVVMGKKLIMMTTCRRGAKAEIWRRGGGKESNYNDGLLERNESRDFDGVVGRGRKEINDSDVVLERGKTES